MLNVTLLGSGGGMPMPERHLSSLMINYKGRKILVDCGEGTQVAIRKMNAGFKSIDIICITHVHGDHIFGIPGLLSTMGNSQRLDPVTIVGPKGISDVMRGLLLSIKQLPYSIEIIEDPKGKLGITNTEQGLKIKEQKDGMNDEITVSTLELDHSAPCFGYSFYLNRRPKFEPEKAIKNDVPRLIWSKLQKGETIVAGDRKYSPDLVLGEQRRGIKLTYITDTRPTKDIPQWINQSDLFICEGTYGDNDDMDKAIKNKHMTFMEAGELAKKGKVKELLLTHFSPALKEPNFYEHNAKKEFAHMTIGYDGYRKTIEYKD